MTTDLKDFGNKVRLRRTELELSQEDLAKKIGYKTKGSIARIEKGERDLPIDKLKDIAKALHTTPEYLLGWDKSPTPNIEIVNTNKIISMPVYESISAGYGAILDSSFIDETEIEYIPLPEFPNWKYCFAVKVRGDSMEPTIPNDATIIINTELVIENNKIGAFFINNEAFLKRKKIIDNNILLISDNKEYEPIIIKDIDDFKEIGKVIKVVVDY